MRQISHASIRTSHGGILRGVHVFFTVFILARINVFTAANIVAGVEATRVTQKDNINSRNANDHQRHLLTGRRLLQGSEGDNVCNGSLYNPEVVEELRSRGTIRWAPNPEKFLVAYCVRNQISNRMLCLRNHLLVAGYLNRTLVVPYHKKENHKFYDLRVVFDVEHARNCFGRAVFTTAEYRRKYRHPLVVDRITCWHGPDKFCPQNNPDLSPNCPAKSSLPYADREVSGMQINDKYFRAQFLKIPRSILVEAACLPEKISLQELLATFGDSPAQALVIGDLVNIEVDAPGLSLLGDVPFFRTRHCPSAISVLPESSLFEAARNFVAEFLGGRPYLGVHWRRGDFKAYCFWHGPKNACYFPPHQVAACIFRQAKRLNLNTIFLATNGKRKEIDQLTWTLRAKSNGSISVVQLPRLATSADWLFPVVKKKIDQLDLVAITLEKLIVGFSTVFLGSVVSTFTMDIQRMRHGLGTASCHDTTICLGEKEWIRNRG